MDLLAHTLVEAQAAERPDTIAVSWGDTQLTYGALNRRANQLAHLLRARGAGPETLVALCLPRTPEMVVAILGTLKAGAAYLPLDLAYPPDRLAYMLEDSGAVVVLTATEPQNHRTAEPEDAHAGSAVLRFRGSNIPIDAPYISQQPNTTPEAHVSPANLAYVIYTSGSTGQPKGVQIEHRGLINLVRWHQEAYRVTPADRAIQVASPAFDASVWEIWPYLTAGASVHIVPDDVRTAPDLLHAWLLSQAITLSWLPVLLAERLLTMAWPAHTPLRSLLTGADTLRRYPASGLPFTLVNNYGPTENTVITTFGTVPPADQSRPASSPSIGKPISNVQIYILDESLRPVPPGLPGELYIGGASLARGYLGRPELTAEKFVPNPFVTTDDRRPTTEMPPENSGRWSVVGGRLYKTGDLARLLPDGTIDFLGRADFQVKLRGYRIELGEIEAALAQHPSVRDVVVVAREDTPGEKRLVAYVVLRTEGRGRSEDAGRPPDSVLSPQSSVLREHLAASLPLYMVPSAFVELNQLPLTPNGKIDRKALPAPTAIMPDDRFVAPRTPLEEALANMWAEALEIARVGVNDHFFEELGGHSLRATQVVSRVRQVFQVNLTVGDLFEAPTIAALAHHLVARETQPGRTDKIAFALKRMRTMTAEQRQSALQRHKEPDR